MNMIDSKFPKIDSEIFDKILESNELRKFISNIHIPKIQLQNHESKLLSEFKSKVNQKTGKKSKN